MMAMANHSAGHLPRNGAAFSPPAAHPRTASILQVMADVFDADVFTLRVSNTACLGAALRAFHFDRAASSQPLSWPQAVAGFTDSTHAASPSPANVEIYRVLRARYAAFESQALKEAAD